MNRHLTALAVAGLSLLGACNSEPVNLKFNVSPGTSFQYTSQAKVQVELGGYFSNQDITNYYTYQVAAGPGNNIKLTTTLNRTKMTQSQTGQQPVSYDSNDPEHAAIEDKMSLVNKPFTLTINPQGKIEQVEGLEAIIDGMVDSASPDAAMIRQQAHFMFNDSSVRTMMQQTLSIYPNEPVKPGDTWKRNISSNVVFLNLDQEMTYKLVSVKKGMAHITVKGPISSRPVNDPAFQGMEMKATGEQSGTMDVEVKTGILRNSKISQKITGTVKQPGNPNPMNFTITSETTVSGTKK